MFPLQRLLNTIRATYPDLEIRSAEPDSSGQFNHVLLINGGIIFRFPRYSEGIEVLEREAAILDTVCDQLPLPVPDFTFRNLQDRPLGEAFVGYRRLPGKPLAGETLREIQHVKTIRRLAFQLGGFLDALHHVRTHNVTFDLPIKGMPGEWEQMYRDIRTLLFPHMRPDAQQWAKTHFETYLDDAALQQYQPCLIHGDFGPGNVLYDEQSHTISGVIDFGFAGLGDPAQDIAAASCFGDAYLQHFPAAYPHVHTLLPRARFIKGTFALQEALHGIKSGDKEAFKSGMEQYV